MFHHWFLKLYDYENVINCTRVSIPTSDDVGISYSEETNSKFIRYITNIAATESSGENKPKSIIAKADMQTAP